MKNVSALLCTYIMFVNVRAVRFLRIQFVGDLFYFFVEKIIQVCDRN